MGTPTPKQTAATLRQRADAARRARRARADALRAQLEHQLPELLGPSAKAWIFGSLVWGGFGDKSDIDIATQAVSPEHATRIETALTRALRTEIDVLRLEELPDPFRRRIEQEGVLIRGA